MASSISVFLPSSKSWVAFPRSFPHNSIQGHMSLTMAFQQKNGQTWCAVSVSSTNPFAGLPLSMACRARQSGVFFVLLAKKAQDKLLSFPYPSLSALV